MAVKPKFEGNPQARQSFSGLLSNPSVRERWERVRKYFFLRESTYDMSNRCNLRCEGCYYYEGEKQFAAENRAPEAWRALMRAEKERGITFVVLAGAEPALVPELLQVCYEEIPLGAIATNGTIRIPDSVGYKIHISAWGNDRTTESIGSTAVFLNVSSRHTRAMPGPSSSIRSPGTTFPRSSR